MIDTAARIVANTIVWTIVILLVILPALLGSLASVVCVVLALLLMAVLRGRGLWAETFRQPALLLFLLSFAIIVGCYAITARDPGNLLYASALLGLPLAPAVWAGATRWRLDNPALMLAVFSLVGTLVCALVAANSSYLLNTPRAVGFLMGPNVLARIAMLLAFIALSGLFLTQSKYRDLFYLGPLLAAEVLGLTATRGALLALPVMIAVTAVMLWDHGQRRREYFKLGAVTVLCLLIVFASSYRFGGLAQVVGDVASGTPTADGATTERLLMLHGALGAFFHSPWVGFGWGNLRPAAALAIDMTPFGGDAPGGAFQFHNDFANFGVAAGLAGIVALLAIFAAPIVGALTAPRDAYFRARFYCCLQLSIGYLVFGLTDFSMGYDLPTTLYAFLTAMVLGVFRERPQQPV